MLKTIWDVIRALRSWRRTTSSAIALAPCICLPLLLHHILRAQRPLTVLGIIVVTAIVQILCGLSRRRDSRKGLRVRKPHARIGSLCVSLLLRCSSTLRRTHWTLLWPTIPLIMVFRDTVVVVLLASGAVLGIIVTHLRMPVADEMCAVVLDGCAMLCCALCGAR